MSDVLAMTGVDLTDPGTYERGVPHEAFARLRAEAPVAWHPHPVGGSGGDGFWALTRYDDVVAVSRDSATFSSQRRGVFYFDPGDGERATAAMMMLTADPPRHTRLRLLVNKGFTPRGVQRLHDRIEHMAAEIVSSVLPRGGCDFVSDVAGALPSMVIAELLGIPVDDGRRLYELTERLHTNQDDPAASGAHEAIAEMFAYADALAVRKRAEPADDIVSALLAAEVDGERLTDLEFDLFFMLLLNAGGDTTRNLVAAGTLALLERPTDLARLRADPSLVPSAVEELLRFTSPVIVFTRTATRDVELHGVTIGEGDRVAVYYPAANRDERRFAEPDRLDLTRSPNPHVAFGGGGTHFCLGANLARVEAAAMFREVVGRLHGLELTGPVERLRSNLIAGIRTMPVAWSA